jgi:two-component system LytT family response regulator
MKSEKPRIRTIVVDDEPLARRRLCRLLERHAEIELVAQCRNGREGLAAVEEHEPDLLFLDVQMPQMDGLAFLEALGPDRSPAVVFVTAFDAYAVRAFDLHAVDYLLKPYDEERFALAVARAIDRVRGGRDEMLGDELVALVEELRGFRREPGRILVRADHKVVFLRTEEVDWIAAESKYVRVHAGGKSYLYREGIGSLQAQLDPRHFMRIHRSTIVNLDSVRELHDWFHGEYVVILRDGTRLTMSRRYRANVARFLGERL